MMWCKHKVKRRETNQWPKKMYLYSQYYVKNAKVLKCIIVTNGILVGFNSVYMKLKNNLPHLLSNYLDETSQKTC